MDWFFWVIIIIPLGAVYWVYRQAQMLKGES